MSHTEEILALRIPGVRIKRVTENEENFSVQIEHDRSISENDALALLTRNIEAVTGVPCWVYDVARRGETA